jgi:outer membrane protein assembly factor BamB
VAWNDENATDQMTRDGDRRKAHSTPIIVRTDDKLQMLIPGAKAAYSYDPRTGRELWRVQYDAWSAASMALCTKGLAIFISGFGGTTEILAVKTDGQGDVTKTHIAWRYDKMVSKTASPILVNGLLYMISDDGMITCLEPETGVQVWRERIAGAYASSPIYADGRIYFCNQQGKTFVVKPGRTCEILATNFLDTGSLASPAVQDKAIYLRTKTHLYRIENTGK